MHIDGQELAESYRHLSEAEIAELYAQMDNLTEPARVALESEIKRRRMNGGNLLKLHAAELRHEALFDRLQTQRRKKLAWYLLTRNDPKGLIAAVLAFFLLVLISELIRHHH